MLLQQNLSFKTCNQLIVEVSMLIWCPNVSKTKHCLNEQEVKDCSGHLSATFGSTCQ